MTYPNVEKVPYEMIRDEIQSADLLFCSGQSAMSKMIRAATDSVWSHVGFVLRVESINRILVLESVESIGVRTVPLSHYIATYSGSKKGYPGKVFLARHAQVRAADPLALRHFSQSAVDLLGYPYDNKELAAIALRIVAAKLGMPLPPRPANHLFICSEYMVPCFTSLGIQIPSNSAGFLAPKDWATCHEVSFLWELDIVWDP